MLKSFRSYEDFRLHSILTNFAIFGDFLIFPGYKKTRDVKMRQMMSEVPQP